MAKSTTLSYRRNLNLGTHVVASVHQDSYYDYESHEYRTRDRVFTYRAPLKSAAVSAEVFRRAIRLTPAELLRDASFRALARTAAEAGKTYSSDLLEWEKKDVVVAAVAIVAAEVAAERAEAARLAEIARAQAAAKLAAEAPVRDAVTAAYTRCGYRTCTQGHGTRVEIGTTASAAAGTVQGDRYSSRCTYRRTLSRHTITVRADYLDRVVAVGGGTYDGCLVLDAEVVGVTGYATPVHEIRIVRQGAGTGLRTERERVTVRAGRWVALPVRVASAAIPMPGPILADYLEDRGVPTAEVIALRAGHVS